MAKTKVVRAKKSEAEMEQDKVRRETAREFFKGNPDKTAKDLYAFLKDNDLWPLATASTKNGMGNWKDSTDKAFNVWANNQKRAALGTTPATKEHDRLERMKAIAEMSKTLGGVEKATEVLQQLKKLGDIGTALKSLKEYQEVVKTAGKESEVVKFIDAMIENVGR